MTDRPHPTHWAPVPFRAELPTLSVADRQACEAEIADLAHRVQSAWAALPDHMAANPEPEAIATVVGALVLDAVASRFEEAQVALVRELGTRSHRVGPALRPLLVAALDQADREGLMWTPLLDALIGHNAWSPDLQGPPARLSPLRGWVAAQVSQAALKPLRRFRSLVVGMGVARGIRGSLVGGEWVDWALGFTHPAVIEALWKNETLSEAAGSLIVRRVVDVLVESVRPPESRSDGARLFPPPCASTFMTDTVLVFTGRETRLSPSQVKRLTRAAEQAFRAGSDSRASVMLDDVLLRNHSTPESVVASILERKSGYRLHWLLMRHPQAPLEALRSFAQKDEDSWYLLVRNPRAVRDSEVRRHLRTSDNPEVLVGLIGSVPEGEGTGEAEALFRGLLEKAPAAALDLVLSGGLPTGVGLRDGDVGALLEHPDGEVRMRALMLAHHMGDDLSGESLVIPPSQAA